MLADLAVHDADAFKAISDKAKNRIRECLMGDNLSDLSNSAIQEINECSSSNDLESIRVKYLGKKGTVTAALKSLSKIDPRDRPAHGKESTRSKH